MNSTFGRHLNWIVAGISGGLVVLAIVLDHGAAALPGGLGRWLGHLAWLAALANAVFVFWLVYRFLHPVRQLIAAAQEAGVALPAPVPVRSMLPQGDALDQVEDICARVGHVLPVAEAQRLFPLILCRSLVMRRLLSVLQRAAPTTTTVLILGESGTGKELVARSLHANSRRSEQPFVAVNCAAMPASLLESELFGHEKGAFTGAVAQRQGLFETASGGTVFLDEVGDMPIEMQAKLLRVLQEHSIQRVGGNLPVAVDVRIVAATHRDLRALIAEKRFREDLFFRISVLQVRLPPLRERREDVPLLAQAFLDRLAGRSVVISREALGCLVAYDWPGNVRELQNATESALLLADGEVRPEHLPPRIAPGSGPLPALTAELTALVDAAMLGEGRTRDGWPSLLSSALPIPPGAAAKLPSAGGLLAAGVTLDSYLESCERTLLDSALRRAAGVQVEAARLLGIKERSLWHRVKKHGIDVSQFRDDLGKTQPGTGSGTT
jgi:Nif-specific regulatory protein